MTYLTYRPVEKERDQAIVTAVDDNVIDHQGWMPEQIRNRPNPPLSKETIANIQKLFNINISRNPHQRLTPRDIISAQRFFIELIEIIGSKVHEAIPLQDKIRECEINGLEKALHPYVLRRWSHIQSSDLDIRTHRKEAFYQQIESMSRAALKCIYLAERDPREPPFTQEEFDNISSSELCSLLNIPEIVSYDQNGNLKYRLIKLEAYDLDGKLNQVDLVSGEVREFTLFEHTNCHFKVDKTTLDKPSLGVTIETEDGIHYLQALLLQGYGIILTRNPENKDYRGAMNYLSAVLKGFIELKNTEYAIYLKMLLDKYILDSRWPGKLAQHIRRLIGAHHRNVDRACTLATFMFELSLPNDFHRYLLNRLWVELFKHQKVIVNGHPTKEWCQKEPIAVLRVAYECPSQLIEAALMAASVLTLSLPCRQFHYSKHRVDFTNPFGPPMLGLEIGSRQNDNAAVHHLLLNFNPLKAVQAIHECYFSKPEMQGSLQSKLLLSLMTAVLAPGSLKDTLETPQVIKYHNHLDADCQKAISLIEGFVSSTDPFIILSSVCFLSMFMLHGSEKAEKLLFEHYFTKLLHISNSELQTLAKHSFALLLCYLCPVENCHEMEKAITANDWCMALCLTHRPILCKLGFESIKGDNVDFLLKLLPHIPSEVLSLFYTKGIPRPQFSDELFANAMIAAMKQSNTNVRSTILLSFFDTLKVIHPQTAFWLYRHCKLALHKESCSPILIADICSNSELLSIWRKSHYWEDCNQSILLPLASKAYLEIGLKVFPLIDSQILPLHKKAAWIELLYKAIEYPDHYVPDHYSLEQWNELQEFFYSLAKHPPYLEALFFKQLEQSHIIPAIDTLHALRSFHSKHARLQFEEKLLAKTNISTLPQDKWHFLFFSQLLLKQLKLQNFSQHLTELTMPTVQALTELHPFPTELCKNFLIAILNQPQFEKKENLEWISSLAEKLLRNTLTLNTLSCLEMADILTLPYFSRHWNRQNSSMKEIRQLLLELVHRLIEEGATHSSVAIIKLIQSFSLQVDKHNTPLLASLGRRDQNMDVFNHAITLAESQEMLTELYYDLLLEKVALDLKENKSSTALIKLVKNTPELAQYQREQLQFFVEESIAHGKFDVYTFLNIQHSRSLVGLGMWLVLCCHCLINYNKFSKAQLAPLVIAFAQNIALPETSDVTSESLLCTTISILLENSLLIFQDMSALTKWDVLRNSYVYVSEKHQNLWNELAVELANSCYKESLREHALAILIHEGTTTNLDDIAKSIIAYLLKNLNRHSFENLEKIVTRYGYVTTLSDWKTLWDWLYHANSETKHALFSRCHALWEAWPVNESMRGSKPYTITLQIIALADPNTNEDVLASYISLPNVLLECLHSDQALSLKMDACINLVKFSSQRIDSHLDFLFLIRVELSKLKAPEEKCFKLDIDLFIQCLNSTKLDTLEHSSSFEGLLNFLVNERFFNLSRKESKFKYSHFQLFFKIFQYPNLLNKLNPVFKFKLVESLVNLIAHNPPQPEKFIQPIEWALSLKNEEKHNTANLVIELLDFVINRGKKNAFIKSYLVQPSSVNVFHDFFKRLENIELNEKSMNTLIRLMDNTDFSASHESFEYFFIQKFFTQLTTTSQNIDVNFMTQLFLRAYTRYSLVPHFFYQCATPALSFLLAQFPKDSLHYQKLLVDLLAGFKNTKQAYKPLTDCNTETQLSVGYMSHTLLLRLTLENPPLKTENHDTKFRSACKILYSLMTYLKDRNELLSNVEVKGIVFFLYKLLFYPFNFTDRSSQIQQLYDYFNANPNFKFSDDPKMKIWMANNNTLQEQIKRNPDNFIVILTDLATYIHDYYRNSYRIFIDILLKCAEHKLFVVHHAAFIKIFNLLTESANLEKLQNFMPLLASNRHCFGRGCSDEIRNQIFKIHLDYIIKIILLTNQAYDKTTATVAKLVTEAVNGHPFKPIEMFNDTISSIRKYIGILVLSDFFQSEDAKYDVIHTHNYCELVKTYLDFVFSIDFDSDTKLKFSSQNYKSQLIDSLHKLCIPQIADIRSVEHKDLYKKLYAYYIAKLHNTVNFQIFVEDELKQIQNSCPQFLETEFDILEVFSNVCAPNFSLQDLDIDKLHSGPFLESEVESFCTKISSLEKMILTSTPQEERNEQYNKLKKWIFNYIKKGIAVNKIKACQRILESFFQLMNVTVTNNEHQDNMMLLLKRSLDQNKNKSLYQAAIKSEFFIFLQNHPSLIEFMRDLLILCLRELKIMPTSESLFELTQQYFNYYLKNPDKIEIWSYTLINILVDESKRYQLYKITLESGIKSKNIITQLIFSKMLIQCKTAINKTEANTLYFDIAKLLLEHADYSNVKFMSMLQYHLALAKEGLVSAAQLYELISSPAFLTAQTKPTVLQKFLTTFCSHIENNSPIEYLDLLFDKLKLVNNLNTLDNLLDELKNLHDRYLGSNQRTPESIPFIIYFFFKCEKLNIPLWLKLGKTEQEYKEHYLLLAQRDCTLRKMEYSNSHSFYAVIEDWKSNQDNALFVKFPKILLSLSILALAMKKPDAATKLLDEIFMVNQLTQIDSEASAVLKQYLVEYEEYESLLKIAHYFHPKECKLDNKIVLKIYENLYQTQNFQFITILLLTFWEENYEGINFIELVSELERKKELAHIFKLLPLFYAPEDFHVSFLERLNHYLENGDHLAKDITTTTCFFGHYLAVFSESRHIPISTFSIYQAFYLTKLQSIVLSEALTLENYKQCFPYLFDNVATFILIPQDDNTTTLHIECVSALYYHGVELINLLDREKYSILVLLRKQLLHKNYKDDQLVITDCIFLRRLLNHNYLTHIKELIHQPTSAPLSLTVFHKFMFCSLEQYASKNPASNSEEAKKAFFLSENLDPFLTRMSINELFSLCEKALERFPVFCGVFYRNLLERLKVHQLEKKKVYRLFNKLFNRNYLTLVESQQNGITQIIDLASQPEIYKHYPKLKILINVLLINSVDISKSISLLDDFFNTLKSHNIPLKNKWLFMMINGIVGRHVDLIKNKKLNKEVTRDSYTLFNKILNNIPTNAKFKSKAESVKMLKFLNSDFSELPQDVNFAFKMCMLEQLIKCREKNVNGAILANWMSNIFFSFQSRLNSIENKEDYVKYIANIIPLILFIPGDALDTYKKIILKLQDEVEKLFPLDALMKYRDRYILCYLLLGFKRNSKFKLSIKEFEDIFNTFKFQILTQGNAAKIWHASQGILRGYAIFPQSLVILASTTSLLYKVSKIFLPNNSKESAEAFSSILETVFTVKNSESSLTVSQLNRFTMMLFLLSKNDTINILDFCHYIRSFTCQNVAKLESLFDVYGNIAKPLVCTFMELKKKAPHLTNECYFAVNANLIAIIIRYAPDLLEEYQSVVGMDARLLFSAE